MQATPLSAAALHRPPLVLLCCFVGVGVTLRVGLLLSWFSEVSKESSSTRWGRVWELMVPQGVQMFLLS